MGRNGLPVSIARSLAKSLAKSLARQAEDEEQVRLQTALRGRRLPAGLTHRPQSYAVDRAGEQALADPVRSMKPLAAIGPGRSRVPSPHMWSTTGSIGWQAISDQRND